MKFKPVENPNSDIERFLKQHFGIVEEPYSGPTYIFRDGSMLDISSY